MAVQPVFLRGKDIPSSEDHFSGLGLCVAAEKSTGKGAIKGAQEIRNLWRIYPATREARNDMLLKGLSINGVQVQVADINPFILRQKTGEEKPATKVWVADIPLSVANSEIELALNKIGCELRSDIKQERYRDADNKLTRFETGRRFVFVTVPATPLDPVLKVGPFQGRVYHKEQRTQQRTLVCSNCLQTGHHASMCTESVVCRACHESGHKQGSEDCKAVPAASPSASATSDHTDTTPTGSSPQCRSDREGAKNGLSSSCGNVNGGKGQGSSSTVGSTTKSDTNSKKKDSDKDSSDKGTSRSRAPTRSPRSGRQLTLHSSLTRVQLRRRSETPGKRSRSRDQEEGDNQGLPLKHRKQKQQDQDRRDEGEVTDEENTTDTWR